MREGRDSHVWLFAVGAGDDVCLLDGPGVFDCDPAWSPDGARLSVIRLGPREPALDIWEVGVAGDDLRRVPSGFGVVVGPVSWSPDGQRLAFLSLYPEGIYVLNRAGGPPVRVTDHDDFFPDWSPDGKRLVFARATSRLTEGELWVCSPEGGTAEKLPVDAVGVLHPRWSPDGTHLAFAADVGGRFDVFCATPDGREVLNITSTPDQDEAWPDWSPDGSRLVFYRMPRPSQSPEAFGPGDLFICEGDGSQCTQLTHLNAQMSGAAWQPHRGNGPAQDEHD